MKVSVRQEYETITRTKFLRLQYFYLCRQGASVSAYVCLTSAVQTLEEKHGISKLYTICLGG